MLNLLFKLISVYAFVLTSTWGITEMIVEEPQALAVVSKHNNTNIFVIMCDQDPCKFLIVDEQGTWLKDVREIEITANNNTPPRIKCIIYSGLYKPTNPQYKLWPLSQIKTVSAKDFQAFVDDLQDNPTAIKKYMKR